MSLLPTVVSSTGVLGAHEVEQGYYAGTFKSGLGVYVCILGTQADSLFHAFSSPDGVTWTEQDLAHAPERAFSQTGYQQGSSCVKVGNVILCFANHAVAGTLTNLVSVSRFDMGSMTWTLTHVSTLTFDPASCALVCHGELIAIYRATDQKVVLIAQAAEHNSSDAFCTPWPYFAHYDVIGDSFDANWTALVTVGSAVRAVVGYPIGAVMDASDNCYVFMRASGNIGCVKLNVTDAIVAPYAIPGAGVPDSQAESIFPIVIAGVLYMVYSTVGGEFLTMASSPIPAGIGTWAIQNLVDLITDFISGLPGVFVDVDGSMRIWYLNDQGTGGIQSLLELSGPPGGPFTGPTLLATAASRANKMQAMSAGSVTALFVIAGNATASLFVSVGEVAFITLTAVAPGVGGNAITFQVVGVGIPGQTLMVTVIGNAITLQVATDGTGIATSMLSAVVALLQGTAAVTALVNITNNSIFDILWSFNYPLTHLAGGASAGGGTGFFFSATNPAPPGPSNAPVMIPIGSPGGPLSVILPDPNFLCAFARPKRCKSVQTNRNFVMMPGKVVYVKRP